MVKKQKYSQKENENSQIKDPAFETKDWQMSKKTILSRTSHLYLSDLMSDVTFHVGSEDGQDICGHKLILSMGSPVFHTMFYGDFKESQESIKIDVPDIEPTAFKEFLRYIYVDKSFLSKTNVISVLYCSRKYMMPFLAKECENFLNSILAPELAFSMISKTRIFDIPNFIDNCWKTILGSPERAYTSPSFVDIDQTTLIEAMANKPSQLKEISAFNAAYNWAVTAVVRNEGEECKNQEKIIRSIIEPAIKLINFTKMTHKEYLDSVASKNIFSSSEMIASISEITYNKPIEVTLAPKKACGRLCAYCKKPCTLCDLNQCGQFHTKTCSNL
eukprot:TRINITY_DN110_c0_g3_i1.p1 TRINITY_DN110_c0_g3~~TRINITY_DN110_c0_g3_i1.p1  ORF type:complete len:331 (+),score=9.97 TRINITY_DN110_c0_g3_i1:350-1342(+)